MSDNKDLKELVSWIAFSHFSCGFVVKSLECAGFLPHRNFGIDVVIAYNDYQVSFNREVLREHCTTCPGLIIVPNPGSL